MWFAPVSGRVGRLIRNDSTHQPEGNGSALPCLAFGPRGGLLPIPVRLRWRFWASLTRFSALIDKPRPAINICRRRWPGRRSSRCGERHRARPTHPWMRLHLCGAPHEHDLQTNACLANLPPGNIDPPRSGNLSGDRCGYLHRVWPIRADCRHPSLHSIWAPSTPDRGLRGEDV
jgi:hypothetical protein